MRIISVSGLQQPWLPCRSTEHHGRGTFMRERWGIFWITITSAWPALAGSGAWSQTLAKPLPTLVHADQIRRLSPEQAALGYPVRVRGVITMDAPAPDFFIQDTT